MAYATAIIDAASPTAAKTVFRDALHDLLVANGWNQINTGTVASGEYRIYQSVSRPAAKIAVWQSALGNNLLNFMGGEDWDDTTKKMKKHCLCYVPSHTLGIDGYSNVTAGVAIETNLPPAQWTFAASFTYWISVNADRVVAGMRAGASQSYIGFALADSISGTALPGAGFAMLSDSASALAAYPNSTGSTISGSISVGSNDPTKLMGGAKDALANKPLMVDASLSSTSATTIYPGGGSLPYARLRGIKALVASALPGVVHGDTVTVGGKTYTLLVVGSGSYVLAVDQAA